MFKHRWKATEYREFDNMDIKEAKRMLGSYGAWPKDNPPKIVKNVKAKEIPAEFESEKKWPGSIHPIRNQVNY